MGERLQNNDDASGLRSIRNCLRAVYHNHCCAEDCNAQSYSDDKEHLNYSPLTLLRGNQKQASHQEGDYENCRRVKDLHGFITHRIDVTACICISCQDIAAYDSTSIPKGGKVILEPLLLYGVSVTWLWFVRQIAAHCHAARDVRIERSNPVRNGLFRFRHVRHAVLSANLRRGNNLRKCRRTDDRGCCCRKSKKGKHFLPFHHRREAKVSVAEVRHIVRREIEELLTGQGNQENLHPTYHVHDRDQNDVPFLLCELWSIKVFIIQFEKAVVYSAYVILLTGCHFDFFLKIIEQLDRVRLVFAEATSQRGNRDLTYDDPASVRHRKTNMFPRVCINNRGPSRKTNDRHDKPLWCSSAPEKFRFIRQRAIEEKRASIFDIYFHRVGMGKKIFLKIRIYIGRKLTDYLPIRAFGNLQIRWQPLALDIAGAA